jgi:uncharacterized protein YbjT (DUF2867 family)
LSNPEIKKIGVIGGTGMLGQPVVKALVSAGYNVVLLVRDKLKAQQVFSDTVTYIQGNLINSDDIRELIHQSDALYINLSVPQNSTIQDFQPERDGLKKIVVEAEKSYRIKHIAYLSSLSQFYTGRNHWVLQLKRDSVEQVKQGATPYTIFYPSVFMESLPFKQMIGRFLVYAGRSPVKLWWIAAEDYARQVAKSFSLDLTESREYVMQGPQGLTMKEAVSVFTKNYRHRKVWKLRVPLWAIKMAGRYNREANYGYQIMDSIINYPEKFDAEKTWKELGKPGISLKQYAEDLTL